jgi:copper chaperone CopZ
MMRYVVALLIAGLATAWAVDVKKVDLTVKGMHCEDCSGKVKSALQKIKDVKDVEVSLKEGTAQVSLDAGSDVSAEVLAKAVADAGFTSSYKDGNETKTLTASKTALKDKDCSGKDGDLKADCAKEGKSGCCMEKSSKAKTMKKK